MSSINNILYTLLQSLVSVIYVSVYVCVCVCVCVCERERERERESIYSML